MEPWVQTYTPLGGALGLSAVLGLTGATGTLPRYYSEVLGQSLRNRSRAMHDFFDLPRSKRNAFVGWNASFTD